MSQTAAIREALHGCKDPELGVDIVNLGLIYGIEADDAGAKITMTLTTPGCPLTPFFQQDIEQRVQAVIGQKPVTIEVTFDPPWSPSKMTQAGREQLTMMR